MLQACDVPLSDRYDLAMFDLDGVLYVGDRAVPGAAAAVGRARAAGMRVAFVTNNASRPLLAVAERLQRLGIDAGVADVVTSAQAAARVLRERLGPGARVHVLGGSGLIEALRAESLEPAQDYDGVQAIVSGYGPDVLWRDVMQAAVRIRDGLWWVASNADLTIPTDFGLAPGHGVQVRMLEQFSGVTPVIAGKPAPPLLQETIRRVGGHRPLMVGDRLDTDIEGAQQVAVDSLLVLTGVTGLTELVGAPPHRRPTYLAPDLGGLDEAQPDVVVRGDLVACGGWQATARGDRLVVAGTGAVADWWRAVAVAGWRHLDDRGACVDVTGLDPPGRSAPVSAR